MSAETRTPGALQGIMLLLPITMSVMGVSVLAPVVPLLLKEFPNHEYLVLGGVLTMPAIWMLLFSPFAGWLADRFGRRSLLLVSMVVYGFAGAAPVVLDSLYAIIASRVVVGICESIVATVSTTMISDYFSGRTRERWLASQTAVASISALAILYLGGELGARIGWRGPFYLYLYSLPLALLVRATVWEPAKGNAARQAGPAEAAAEPFPVARTVGICAITLLASICFYTVITKNAEALTALGVTNPAEIGKLTMLASIGVPVGTFVYWGIGTLRIGWLLLIDFLLIGVGFLLMGQATAAVPYAWGSFVNQIGCGLVLPTMLVWATRGVAYSIRGRVNGIWQAAFAIGQFLSGMVVTLLSEYLDGLMPTLAMMGKLAVGLAIIAGIFGLLGRGPRHPQIQGA